MQKKFLILLFVLAFTQLSWAEQIINLKDGSIIKGTVISLENNVYRIQTQNLGEIKIQNADVVTITNEDATAASVTSSHPENIDLKAQVQQAQGNLMSDPTLMNDVQSLAQDPEIIKMLSDPNLVNDIMSYDQKKIEQNPKIKELMENPSMKALMEKMENKMEKK